MNRNLQQDKAKESKKKEEEKEILLTRSGYEVSEAFHAFQTAITESGTAAIGKALHFGADLVCSGGIDLFKKSAWDLAIHHIGLASPRIFVYLRKRLGELDALVKKLPHEQLYKDEEFQTRVSEIIYVLQGCPRRSSLKWPAVGTETHTDGWLRAVKEAPDSSAVLRTWKGENDLQCMRVAANEIVKSALDGGSEKALFWVRWLLEEDGRVRKENGGAGLTTLERGPATLSSKKRTDPGYYLLAVFAEVYKDLAGRNVVRMHEEFQTLLDIWRGTDVSLTAKQRREILGLLLLILTEVPRWKVPAAPSLVKDPVQLSRAVGQSHKFYEEVLKHPPVTKSIMKVGSVKKKSDKLVNDTFKKQLSLEEHLSAYDDAVNNYLGLN